MFGSIQIARIFGIPIRIHFTLLILLPYFALRLAGILGTPSAFWGWMAAAALFTSVALHELGHSIVALAKNCPVRDIILTPIGGVAQLTRLPTAARDEFQIAIAGPLVSLALALACWIVDGLLLAAGWSNIAHVISLTGAINMTLFVFNLAPCFPMDGGRIFRAALQGRLGRLEATRRAVKLGRVLATLFGILGIYYGQPFWIIIAVFIFLAAGAEYRMVQMQEMLKRGPLFPFGPAVSPVDYDVTVSPPPYRR